MNHSDLSPIIVISWTNWKFELYENFLRINRQTTMWFLIQGLKWKKDIYFKNITAIQLKKPGLMAGYMQITLLWGNESRGGVFDAIKDENTISFNSSDNYQKALEIKEYIEDHMNLTSSEAKGNYSNADEIEKLHSLMEKWVITKVEFEQKKRLLLWDISVSETVNKKVNKSTDKETKEVVVKKDVVKWNNIEPKEVKIKWQKGVAIFLIVWWVISLATTIFWWLVTIAAWIIFLPSIFKKIPLTYANIIRKMFYWLAVWLFLLTIIIGWSKDKTTQNTWTNTWSTTSITYIFDIPSLIGKNFDEVKTSFGPELTKYFTEMTNEQLKLWATEWDNTINKNGVDLLITYNQKTRKIIDFFLWWENKDTLMNIGNLMDKSNNYTVEAIQQLKDPTKITGIKITPRY